MISMNRYNKMMDKINVTPEMHERIMNNIQEVDFETEPKKVIFLKDYKKYISIAACLMVCIAGTLLIPNLMKVEQEPPLQVVPDIVEYTSTRELSSSVGFEVKDVKNIPFEVEEIKYISYWKELAEIVYSGDENTLIFRMSEGSDDNSGDYNEYEEVKSYSVDDYTVTLKGSNGLYNLAIWSDGSFSYSLELDVALSETDLGNIIQSIQ